MFKTLMNKQKREDLKDKVEVVFAAFTIISFAVSKYQKHKESEEAEQSTEAS